MRIFYGLLGSIGQHTILKKDKYTKEANPNDTIEFTSRSRLD